MLFSNGLCQLAGFLMLGGRATAKVIDIARHEHYNATSVEIDTVVVSETTTVPCETSTTVWETKTVPRTTVIYDPITQIHTLTRIANVTVSVTIYTTVSTEITHIATYTRDSTITTSVFTTTTVTASPTVIVITPTSTSTFNPCPTECSLYVNTVDVFFWPTTGTKKYPATYVDPSLGYTFVSPSVYMLMPTAYGTASTGRTGPSLSSSIWAFDLHEVSTIVPGSDVTRQLSLSDLGTDCPLTVPQSVLATTIRGGPCDPILAAPEAVKTWAYPCNACQQLGLFDPPYAVPTVTDSSTIVVVSSTQTVVATVVPTTTTAAAPGTTTTIASNTDVVIIETSSTIIIPSETSSTVLPTSQVSVEVSSTSVVDIPTSAVSTTDTVIESGTPAVSTSSTSSVESVPASSTTLDSPPVQTASGTRTTSGLWGLGLVFMAMNLLM